MLEMSIAMMIIAVVGIGASSLMKAAVQNVNNERQQQLMQIVGMNIINDLRYDLRYAETATISSSSGLTNNVLTIAKKDPHNPANNITVTYTQFKDTTRSDLLSLKRKQSNVPVLFKTYNDKAYSSKFEIKCVGDCFTNFTDSDGNIRGINISEIDLTIPDKTVSSSSSTLKKETIVDLVFGTAPNYVIQPSEFTITSKVTFQ